MVLFKMRYCIPILINPDSDTLILVTLMLIVAHFFSEILLNYLVSLSVLDIYYGQPLFLNSFANNRLPSSYVL